MCANKSNCGWIRYTDTLTFNVIITCKSLQYARCNEELLYTEMLHKSSNFILTLSSKIKFLKIMMKKVFFTLKKSIFHFFIPIFC